MSEGAMVRISAVVCTFNRAAYLAKAVESLVNQTCPKEYYEIIVVDNGSTDNTREVVEQFGQCATIRYIYEPVKGLCQARNTGWQAAGGKYVAYLDDDAIATPNWLEKMLEAFETVKPAPASVGGRVIPIWESERPAWLNERMLAAYAIVDWGNRARFFKSSSPEHHVGCNVAYSREVLQKCGGFNVNLGRKGKNLLSNDENLVRKYMDSHGLGIYYDPEILVEHVVPKERLTRRFMLRRHFWQGVSDVVLWYEESSSTHGRLWLLMSGLEGLTWVGLHLTLFFLWSFLRRPLAVVRDLATIETARDYFFRGFDHFWSSLGQSCGYLQIGMGRRAKGTGKGVALEQGASDSSSLPPKNWNRITWWSYPYIMLKRTLFGFGGIALLVIVGLYVAGALVEPARWYLVGTASALLLLGSGLLALSYARFILNRFISDQQSQMQATIDGLKKDTSDNKDTLAKMKDTLAKMNVGNFPLFQQFNRRLTNEDLHRFAVEWAPKLGLNLNTKAMAYIAHRICLAEDTCVGRLSGDIETMLLRVLVARSVMEPNLEVLEIGTLFGVGVAMIHENCKGLFDSQHFTVIDPLIGHIGRHDKSSLDPLTKAPATREIFIHNMQRMNIPKSDYTIIEKLSTEDEAIEQASKRRYNVLIIDADHSYFGVKHDFHNYKHLVKRGGYIIFDDYGNPNWPGLTDFVDKEVAGMPELEFVGTDVFTAVFRVIASQDLIRESATTVATVTTKDESSAGAPSPALTGRDTTPNPSVDYPKQVTLETAAICNAHCDFCPQDKLARRGHIMPMELIEKVILELAEFPVGCPLEIAPNGVNEPLADKRIFDVLNLISGKLPNAKIYFVTNGNLLSRKAITELSKHNLSKVNISLNFCDKKTYEQRTGLQWEKTLAALNMLHEKVVSGEFRHPVYISRVQDESEYDIVFAKWVGSNYSAFGYWPKRVGDWLGSVPNLSHRSHKVRSKCPQWHFMHIASTGAVQRCCMDADAQYPWGNVKTMNLLDIFNQGEWTDLRRGQKSRFEVYPCNKCIYLP